MTNYNIPQSIAIVDFSHMLTVNFHAVGADGAGDQTIHQLRNIRSGAGHTVIALDSKPYWRKTVFDGYKAGRKVEPELVNIWERTLQRVQDEGFNTARAPGEEADDIMATLARIYSEEYGCQDVRLVTQDKDVLQVVNDRVKQLYPILGDRGEFEIRGADHVLKEWGVHPEDLALLLAMMGDTSDKIPGIKQIGKTIGAKLITAYGTRGKHQQTMAAIAEALVAATKASELDGKLPAFWKNYAAGMAELPKWLKLTTLNRNAALELHPLKYLERIEPKQLAPEDEHDAAEPSDADDSVDWDHVVADTEERERQEMAAALPVGTTKSSPPPVGAPIIGKDPRAEEYLAKAAAARELAAQPGATAPGAETLESAAQAWERKAAGEVDESGRARKSEPPAPKAEAAPAGTASTATAAATPPTSEVVPSTQGPARTERPEIRSAETALARVAAPSWALSAQPQTASELLDIARVLWNSRMFEQFGSHRGVFTVMSLGRELGMGYAESLESFFVVNDKPFPKAKWILSRMQAHPDMISCIVAHADDKSATIKAKHRVLGDLSFTYTIEMAARAGFTTGKNRGNWERIPRNMLRARAISMACGDWCPGATFAMRSWEEAQDE